MKKFFTLFAALLILKASFARVDTVNVSNNQFTPATLNAVVGDTILWIHIAGFHTTTSITGSIPAGAATWDAPLQTAGSTFIYILKIAGTYNYECTIHAPNMEGVINASGSLPVVLSSFGAAPTKTNGALISWATATEQNTDHFEVMRSTDGTSFEKISAVAAKGNSSSLTNYTYTDNLLPANYRFLYYSLSIVDKDGRKTLSNITMFRNVNGVPKLIVSLSPNPISRPGHLMLQFNSDKTGSMHVQLFDAAGKMVRQGDLSAVSGLNNGHFHIGEVAPGTYTILFTMDNQKESYKIMVQ